MNSTQRQIGDFESNLAQREEELPNFGKSNKCESQQFCEGKSISQLSQEIFSEMTSQYGIVPKKFKLKRVTCKVNGQNRQNVDIAQTIRQTSDGQSMLLDEAGKPGGATELTTIRNSPAYKHVKSKE